MGGGEWRMGEPGAGRKDPPLATRHSPLASSDSSVLRNKNETHERIVFS